MRGRATRHCWSDCSGRLELAEPVPVVVLHEDVADQRCLGDVRRQLGLRAPEVLAGDAASAASSWKASMRTYWFGSSTLRDHSKNRLPDHPRT